MTDTNTNKEAIEPAEVLEVEPRPTEAIKSEWDKSAEAAQRSPLYEIASLGMTFASTPADALARARTKGKRNEYNPLTLQVGDTLITVDKVPSIKNIGVAASKLLDAGTMAFTAANGRGQNPPQLRVYIDTATYARKCGVEIEAQRMPTPEAQAAEDKRAENDAHNFLAKVRRNIRTLRREAEFSWTETVKGKLVAYSNVGMLSGGRATRKVITLDFGLAVAEYLVKRPVRPMPDALFLADETRENAYAIGKYLNQHYSIDANVALDTERLVSIERILGETSYPTIESIRKSKSKRTWRDLIKERLENDLDYLTGIGTLTTWAYSHPKKRILSDDEAATITTFEEFAGLYLYFEMANYPTHEERATEIEAKRKEQKPRRGTKSKQHKAAAKGGE